MIKYQTLTVKSLKDETIDKIYLNLLKKKLNFIAIKVSDEVLILTKEKSFFKVNNLENFVNESNKDVYFKTINVTNIKYKEEDLKLYFKFLNKYKTQMMKKYASKYLFGSIAVKTTNNNIITTIRGKENFNEFTIVTEVDYYNHIVYVDGKKATLNAPLLYKILKNNDIKIIVHINHIYDEKLPYLLYAFPGTLKDSLRNINKSFNISHHGIFMLFNNNGELI